MKHCLNCGQEFVDRKHKDRIYCSYKCNCEAKKAKVRNCEVCGISFNVTHPNHRFCSQKCGGIGRDRYRGDPSKKTTHTCKVCAKEFTTWAYRQARVCSKRCAAILGAKAPKTRKIPGKVDLICHECGKSYRTTRFFATKRNSRFCSKECAYKAMSKERRGAGNANYRGGTIGNRGANWGTQRHQALARDGYKCQICGKKQRIGKRWQLSVHHIKPYREFNNDYESANELLNLITLCYNCHAKVEHGHLACPRRLL